MTEAVNLYKLNDEIRPVTYRDWTSKWWQWIIGIAEPDFVFLNNDVEESEYARLLLDQDVYFLAANFFNQDETPIRRLRIEPKSDVLLPVVNQFSYTFETARRKELEKRVRLKINTAKNLKATISRNSGKPSKLSSVKISSWVPVKHLTEKLSTKLALDGKETSLFDLVGIDNYHAKSVAKEESHPVGYASGSWIFIKELREGDYEINTSGEMEGYGKGDVFKPQACYKLAVHS